MPVLRLPAPCKNIMLAHINACFPEEACGILGGINQEVTTCLPIGSAQRTSHTYILAEKELLQIWLNLDSLGEVLLGIWHSHPYGPASPSRFDRSALSPELPWRLIWSRQTQNVWQPSAWFAARHGVIPACLSWAAA